MGGLEHRWLASENGFGWVSGDEGEVRRESRRRLSAAGRICYLIQCRHCGQVATAMPVPTDTISSRVSVNEMRTRRIAGPERSRRK